LIHKPCVSANARHAVPSEELRQTLDVSLFAIFVWKFGFAVQPRTPAPAVSSRSTFN
jgi:hypothetical protein